MDKTITEIYTDGSCRHNPGPGGWGAILKYKQHSMVVSKGYRHTTNNRMELMAVIESISLIKRKGVNIDVYSDSKYVVDAINNGWIHKWKKNNFKKIKNQDLWLKFLDLYPQFNIKLIWVKGHANNKLNNECDSLATSASSNDNKSKWEIDTVYEKENNISII